MSVVVVVGGQWGDEGKGKIVDLLAEEASVVVRYSGGNNAGHTVVNSYGEFRLHLVPAGIFSPATLSVIGNGVVLDPASLLQELDELTERGVSVDQLRISDRAQVVMPYHTLLDCLEEQARGPQSIGTTGKGIGPAYVDKVARQGIRVADLMDRQVFHRKLSHALALKNRLLQALYDASPLSLDEVYERYNGYADRLRPFVANTEALVQEAVAGRKNVLLEGAQGTLLDLDFGTYPFVTSSSPIAGGACTGAGLGPTQIDRSVGVFKSYTTRVGHGPFPTEQPNKVGQLIRERGHEFGATTGRPRRCGWFDAVVGRYAAEVNGLSAAAITRLDVLDALEKIKVCTAYRYGGALLSRVPADLEVLRDCEPVYEEHEGWQTETSHARTWDDLPRPAQTYLNRLSELLGVKLDIVSVGAAREQTIRLHPTFAS